LNLVLTPVATGLSKPLGFEVPDDASDRHFVVQQAGTIRIIANGNLLPGNFLDIQGKVNFDSLEMGLLGMAVHPNFAQNLKFYVHYDRVNGGLQSVIAEYKVSDLDPNQADPASERILLTVDQPFPNHKGGQIAFGPDGFLYIGLGDGGDESDPQGNGQSLQTLLGKILRIDVDHTDPGLEYAVPPDNPFAAGGGLPEIWAYGLRNPWRFSFDTSTGRLFVADVGQARFEEIDLVQKGDNLGWNILEGAHCFAPLTPPTSCDTTGLTFPIFEYDHSEGSAVIGGYVYKGSAIPGLAGAYIFGDLSGGKIWELVEGPAGTWTRTLLLSMNFAMTSFGQDASGEIYVLDYSDGRVLKLQTQ
jgi:glucose/arabinose dehydrogenase